jgi:phosphatidylglycerol:prolipoprotein diacylglycerol transferase
VAHQVAGTPLNVPLIPTQPIMCLASLAIFAILIWRYPRKTRDGEIFVLYLALYAGARYFIEFLRGDEDRGFVFNHLLSTSQFIAILALVAAVWMALILRRRPARQRAVIPVSTEEQGRVEPPGGGLHSEVASVAGVKAASMAQAERRNRN